MFPQILYSFSRENFILANLIPPSEKSNDSYNLMSLGASSWRQFFGFDLWLSFLLISFFEILSKTFVNVEDLFWANFTSFTLCIILYFNPMISRNKWSHGTNFAMVLCIKSYLYESFNPLPVMLRILRRRVLWTPQPIEPQKSLALFGLNFECLLKPFNWLALDCKLLD